MGQGGGKKGAYGAHWLKAMLVTVFGRKVSAWGEQQGRKSPDLRKTACSENLRASSTHFIWFLP